MVAQGYFAHDSLSGQGPFDRMRSTGYIGPRIVWNAGETIAWASGAASTPQRVMNAWMNATTQRLTLLAPDFRDIGVGIALGAPVERAPDAATGGHLHGGLRLAHDPARASALPAQSGPQERGASPAHASQVPRAGRTSRKGALARRLRSRSSPAR